MRILVVDDHELVRKGICSVLASDPALTLCGQATDGREAIAKARELRPDVVIMDISMPDMNGLEATREIKRLVPDAEIVMVSQHEAPEMVRQAFNAGARGYVEKSAISTELLKAIATVSRREAFVKVRGITESSRPLDAHEILQRNAAFERALRESEERFRSAMNNMAEGLFILNARGEVTYVNPSAEAMFQWTSAELVGKKIHDVTHYQRPDGRPYPDGDCPSSRVLQGGNALRECEDVFIRKDGSLFPVVFSASALTSDGATVGAVVGFRDDSKRRQAEEALRQSERIYRTIGESINYGVWICDAQGRNVYTSPSLLKLAGLTQEQGSEFSWASVLDPKDARDTAAAWQECVSKGTFWEREHRFRGADGAWHHVLARGGPIRDTSGKILYWAGINLDVRKHKEVEQQLQTLVQTLEARVSERTREVEYANDKLRELSGKLLQAQDAERRRVARELHDGVGQLLAGMSMNLGKVVAETPRLTPGARQSLEDSLALMEQASNEIRTMSYLLHPPLLDEVGLESALRWYIDGFAERSKVSVDMKLSPGFSDGLERDFALSLFRIVQECLTNIHRHSGSPTALIRIERTADQISLEVQDQGKGISPEIQSNISSGASAGVGFRGMRERIRQLGGRLEVRSDGNGTTVLAVLRLAEMSPAREQTDESPAAGPKLVAGRAVAGREVATILCIDDRAVRLRPRKRMLESAGHRVIEARSGEEALRLFRSEKVDAVVLDYWTSGMKRTDVASELKRLNPDVPIIGLSGRADLPGDAAGLVDQWIVKGSHRPEKLLESVSSLLERRPV